MAKFSYIGFDEIDEALEHLDRESIRRITEAGGEAVAERMRNVVAEHHHIVTGDMQKATERGNVRERIGGASVEIYPGAKSDTTGRNGFRNSSKAFMIERGRGKPRRGDDFVTSGNLGYEEKAHEAMTAENEKIMSEVQ